MLNTRILQLEENMINLINESQVPPVIVQLILERIQKEAGIATEQVLKMEQEEIQKQQAMMAQNKQPATPNEKAVVVQEEKEVTIDSELDK